jgi:uncharacterized membrane protein
LADHSGGDDVVLASKDLSNPLAGVISGRVVQGHSVATLHSDEKEALVTRFYAADASAQDRATILQQTGATMVALGPRERALGVTDLSSQPDLTPVYDSDGVELFRVNA